MWKEFKEFLLKQNALALALAVVIGVALNTVVQSIVNDLIMPLVTLVTSAGPDFKDLVIHIGTAKIGIGNLISAVINFIIVGFVAWRISKIVAPPPSPSGKGCPFCKNQVDAAASRCPHCTSQLA
jgi:large conductance mechanosensitive channel